MVISVFINKKIKSFKKQNIKAKKKSKNYLLRQLKTKTIIMLEYYKNGPVPLRSILIIHIKVDLSLIVNYLMA